MSLEHGSLRKPLVASPLGPAGAGETVTARYGIGQVRIRFACPRPLGRSTRQAVLVMPRSCCNQYKSGIHRVLIGVGSDGALALGLFRVCHYLQVLFEVSNTVWCSRRSGETAVFLRKPLHA